MTTEPVTTEKKPVTNTESSTGLLTTQTLPVTKAIPSVSTSQIQSTNGPSTAIFSRGIYINRRDTRYDPLTVNQICLHALMQSLYSSFQLQHWSVYIVYLTH